jgi:hypothetical protein
VEALEALRARDKGGAEDGVDVDRRQREVVGNVGGVEEEGADDEDRGDDDRDRDPQDASPTVGGRASSKASCAGSGFPRRTGAPYGYRSVASMAYAYVCAS